MTDTVARGHSKPVRLAAAALDAAHGRRHAAAAGYIQRIHDECGGWDGLHMALLAWIDTFADHATDGETARGAVPATRMRLLNSDTGALEKVGESPAPASVQWAAKLIDARIRMNRDEFEELFEELPDGARERGQYVWAVLTSVSHTMNGLPRGFARMGRVQPEGDLN